MCDQQYESQINKALVVQASASQGGGVTLVEALKRQRLLTNLQCLHCAAVATLIPVVALPTDRGNYKTPHYSCQHKNLTNYIFLTQILDSHYTLPSHKTSTKTSQQQFLKTSTKTSTKTSQQSFHFLLKYKCFK